MTKRKKQVWGVGDLFAISLLFVNRDLLDSGDWKFFSMASTEFPINKYIKLDELRRDGFINVTSRGSGIVVSINECVLFFSALK
ncbi:hypothetical protein [Listeria marthii]|uniref:hypothetical protein n=1 Tax=Listeria marthii TaxID=529731 RepID=UPI0016281E2C|nr:hypothetical protein [Listeria marthii]MBC2040585.1 hypothetical protein [Listeria marthii]